MSELIQIPPLPDPLIGRVLDGRYRIVSQIADGGMGRVYRAEQQVLDRIVAVKVLRVEVEGEGVEVFRSRFFREAKLSSKLSHPNTVRVYDYGRTEDDVYYIVMEYLQGSTLTALLKHEGPMDPLRTIDLALQICASLAEAHAMGVIHRDLKPDNLMITRQADGQEILRVLDFGIAKPMVDNDIPTRHGVLYGSPGYMAPEQIFEHEVTIRSDIYSVGAVLYRMLTGRRAFSRGAALGQGAGSAPSLTDATSRLVVPPQLEWVVLQCLKKDPLERFSSAHELAWALRACAMEIRGVGGPYGDGTPTMMSGVHTGAGYRSSRRRPAPSPQSMLFVGAVGLFSLLTGVFGVSALLGLLVYGYLQDRPPAGAPGEGPPGDVLPARAEPSAPPPEPIAPAAPQPAAPQPPAPLPSVAPRQSAERPPRPAPRPEPAPVPVPAPALVQAPTAPPPPPVAMPAPSDQEMRNNDILNPF